MELRMRFERMAKLRLYGLISLLLLASFLPAHAQYRLAGRSQSPRILFSNPHQSGFLPNFKDRAACTEYIYKLTDLLRNKGFTAASIDSVQFDSASAYLQLYLGEKFTWSAIRTRPADAAPVECSRLEYKKITGQTGDPGSFAV